MAKKFIITSRRVGTVIPVTHEIIVDDEDAYRLRATVYRVGKDGSVVRSGNDRIRLSHEILGVGYDNNHYVSHVDGNKLNFRRKNMVVLTRKEWNKLSILAMHEARANKPTKERK